MTLAEEIAERVSGMLPRIKSGPLRLWGRPFDFGRPGEAALVIESCDATQDCVRFHSAGGLILAVWNPAGVEIDEHTFRISSASAMRLSWYFKAPMIPANIRYRDFTLDNGWVAFRTNEDRGSREWLAGEECNSVLPGS